MNRFTKSISVLVMAGFFAAFTSFVNAADAITVTADKTAMDVSDTVSVTVELPGGSLFNSAEVVVNYQADKLTYTGTETSEIYSSAFINDLQEKSGKVVLTAAYVSDLAEGGVLGKFTFKPATVYSADGTIDVQVKASNTQFKNTVVNESISIKINGTAPEETTTAPTASPTTAPASSPTARPSSGGGGGRSSGGGSGSSSQVATATPTAAPASAPSNEAAAEATPEPAATPMPEITPAPGKIFTDIDGHWAEESILALYNMGYINGFDDNTFRPEDRVTRAQFVKMIADEKGITPADGEQIFNDVPTDAWYAPYANAAYAAGIVNGDDDGNFNPSSEITRQEMAVMLMRAFLVEADVSNGQSFADASSIADWAAEAVIALSSNGIINGFDDNTFRPLGSATRAQAATVLSRFISE